MFARGPMACYRKVAELLTVLAFRKLGTRAVSIAPAGTYVARESLRFLDADVRIGAETQRVRWQYRR